VRATATSLCEGVLTFLVTAREASASSVLPSSVLQGSAGLVDGFVAGLAAMKKTTNKGMNAIFMDRLWHISKCFDLDEKSEEVEFVFQTLSEAQLLRKRKSLKIQLINDSL
jgi:hypothetical protein